MTSRTAPAPGAPSLDEARRRLCAALDELRALPRDLRLETPCAPSDFGALLASTEGGPRALFASSRTGRRLVAVFAARSFTLPASHSAGQLVAHARAGLAPGTGPLVGAARFAPCRDEARLDPSWRPFGAGLFFLPRVLVEQRSALDGGGFVLAVHLCQDRPLDEERADARRALLALGAGRAEVSPVAAPPVALDDERARFVASVERAVAALSDGRFDKVVLARRAARALPPGAAVEPALSLLEGREPFGASYLLEVPGAAWLGRSPELLVARRGRRLESEAVAGTRPVGATPDDDERLEAELLTSDKDAREHLHVREHLADALSRLGADPRPAAATRVRRLSRVMHLVTAVEATLPDGITDQDLVDTLHPTPALAGTPTNAALSFIEAHEGFDRGLYAGPVGLIDEDGLELWIGIRGARLTGRALTLYAGGGIVDGSEPEAEWQETEAKASALLSVLGGAS